MFSRSGIGIAFFLSAGVASADIPKLRPMPRPALSAVEISVPSVVARPVATSAVRPQPRPQNLETTARNPAKGLLGKVFSAPKSVKGSVCGDPAIKGEVIARIRGKLNGCGIDKPVRVTSVDGVRLSTPAMIDCTTARALKTWVAKGVKPAFGSQKVTGLRVAAHYACRSRNNVRGAKISEHGKGRAIDISGFVLASGVELTVLKDYSSKKGAPIRKAHKAGCGPFGTTLGPGSDGHHRDHIHLDTARHRSGTYCK